MDIYSVSPPAPLARGGVHHVGDVVTVILGTHSGPKQGIPSNEVGSRKSVVWTGGSPIGANLEPAASI